MFGGRSSGGVLSFAPSLEGTIKCGEIEKKLNAWNATTFFLKMHQVNGFASLSGIDMVFIITPAMVVSDIYATAVDT